MLMTWLGVTRVLRRLGSTGVELWLLQDVTLEMKGKMEVFHSIKKLLLIIDTILGQKCKITNDFLGPAVSISFGNNRLLNLEMLIPCGFIVTVFRGEYLV